VRDFGLAARRRCGIADLGQLTNLARPIKVSDRTGKYDPFCSGSLESATASWQRRCVVVVMERDGSVAECVLSKIVRSGGQNGIMGGDYELTHRQPFEKSWQVEMLFPGGERNADMKRRMVQGKGGATKGRLLTGDDPLYVAVAVAFGFFVWASSGAFTFIRTAIHKR
jgi:hypothetical protein